MVTARAVVRTAVFGVMARTASGGRTVTAPAFEPGPGADGVLQYAARGAGPVAPGTAVRRRSRTARYAFRAARDYSRLLGFHCGTTLKKAAVRAQRVRSAALPCKPLETRRAPGATDGTA